MSALPFGTFLVLDKLKGIAEDRLGSDRMTWVKWHLKCELCCSVSFFCKSVCVVLAGLSCRDCLVARRLSHNPEFLFHPRISSQNTGTALQLNCTQHDLIPCNIKEVWGQCILSVHCREEGCVGLYIQADQEISRDRRGEARARGKSWGWSPFFHH